MAGQNDLTVIGATRIPVGLSQIIRLMPSAYQAMNTMKILSGSGTLEIVAPAYSGASTAAASGWGTGYPIGAAEVYSVPSPAIVYLAATGATMVAVLTFGYTNGATVL